MIDEYRNDDSRVNQVTLDLSDYSAARNTMTDGQTHFSLEKD